MNAIAARSAVAVGLEQDREPDAGDDDADVLDRRVGEQPLHVALHGREDHAEQRSQEAKRQRGDAPPPLLRIEEIERDAQQTVDRRLQHHAAHQRRHRRRRRGMRLGQPDVQRQHARFRAEAEQREEERDRGPRRLQALRPASPRTCSLRCRPAVRQSTAGCRSPRRGRSTGTGSLRGGSPAADARW